jgi:hypothetical protein
MQSEKMEMQEAICQCGHDGTVGGAVTLDEHGQNYGNAIRDPNLSSSNATLSAPKALFTVTLMPNGGLIGGDNVPKQYPMFGPIAVGNLEIPQPFSGFRGWSTSPSGLILGSFLMIEGNITLYARYGLSNPPVELMSTAEVMRSFVSHSTQLIDLQTMRTIHIFWGRPDGRHTDWTPQSPSDTAIVQNLVDARIPITDPRWNDRGTWNWNGRTGVVRLGGGRLIAVGFHLFPHGSFIGGHPGWPLVDRSNERPDGGWDVGGHMCMYYGDSTGGTIGLNNVAREAQVLGQNRVFMGQLS